MPASGARDQAVARTDIGFNPTTTNMQRTTQKMGLLIGGLPDKKMLENVLSYDRSSEFTWTRDYDRKEDSDWAQLRIQNFL
jgi:hypothetical protein